METFDRAWVLRCVVAAIACASCGGGRAPRGFEGAGDDGGASGGDARGGGGASLDAALGGGDDAPSFGDDAAAAAPDDCADDAKRVYVLSSNRDLYAFWPPTLAFTKIGTLDCDPSSGPFSMAVDRGGTAWVLYKNGRIFRVRTQDASCAPTAFDPVKQGIDKFGMGFSSNGPGTHDETLFLAGFPGLGKLDLTTMTVTMVGAVSGPAAGAFAELTGTGDGRLYGFFYGAPGSLNEVDKATAKAGPAAPIGSFSTGTAFAFSFWGGDFYLYTANAADTARPTSDVTRFRPSDGSTKTMLSQIGFRIVGAGVSTCAPVAPPR